MTENTEHVTTAAPDAAPDTSGAAGATPPAGPTPEAAKKEFVPFFNPEYEFRLGTLGDVGTAYRLGAIFIVMLIAAVMMYLCAWWWVGTHPLAQHH
jgi:hypothetical protein